MIYDNTLHEIASILDECDRLLSNPSKIDTEGARFYLDRCKLKLSRLVNKRQEELLEKQLNRKWPKPGNWTRAVNE